MFLEDPGRSSFDLNFRLLDTPVRVHPSFWIGSIVFGWNRLLYEGFAYLLIWVACVFVSILVHEFGHIFAGRAFGRQGVIVLYGMGGLAISLSGLRSRWRQIVVSLAGPGAGFLLMFAVLLAFVPSAGPSALLFPYRTLAGGSTDLRLQQLHPYLAAAVADLLWLNLIVGLLNLVPVWPLDGGMVTRELCLMANPQAGLRTSLMISMVVAAVLAINALIPELLRSPENLAPKGIIPILPTGRFEGLFMGILAAGSYQLLRTTPRRGPQRYDDDDAGDRLPWERDADWWKRR